MKTKSNFYTLLLAITVFVFFTNCSGNKKEESSSSHDHSQHASGSSAASEASEPQFDVDDTFQKQLADVFNAYVSMKDALVASDADKVKTEATKTNEALSKVDMKLVSGAAHNDWMNYSSSMQSSLNKISSTENIEEQREAFSTTSDNLYKSVKAFGLGGKEAFYEYCPMAFNNEGGYWLSDQEQIRNPYFGNKMLTCGEVKEKLK